MKTPNPDQPRIYCRIIRFLSAMGFRLTSADSHTETCQSCRAWFAAGESLDTELRREARSHFQSMPDGLEDRVFDSIDIPNQSAGREFGGTRMVLFSLAGVAAACAVAFVLLRGPATSLDLAEIETPAAGVERSSEFITITSIAAIDAVPRGMRNLVDSSPATLKEQNPLQREADAVYSDSRSVLRFLAVNFLPSVPDALSSDPAVPTT
jgi:hypothetical protein